MTAPSNLYDLFGAESLQHDTDQTTADGWSVTYAIGFACFGAGALTTACGGVGDLMVSLIGEAK